MEEEYSVLVRSRSHTCLDVAVAYMSMVAGYGDVRTLHLLNVPVSDSHGFAGPPVQTTPSIA